MTHPTPPALVLSLICGGPEFYDCPIDAGIGAIMREVAKSPNSGLAARYGQVHVSIIVPGSVSAQTPRTLRPIFSKKKRLLVWRAVLPARLRLVRRGWPVPEGAPTEPSCELLADIRAFVFGQLQEAIDLAALRFAASKLPFDASEYRAVVDAVRRSVV